MPLLCRLQACRHCIDGRRSRVCVRAGLDERGDVILPGVAGVRWQRLQFGEWCPAGARAVGGCYVKSLPNYRLCYADESLGLTCQMQKEHCGHN
jgi:hypothetical protein